MKLLWKMMLSFILCAGSLSGLSVYAETEETEQADETTAETAETAETDESEQPEEITEETEEDYQDLDELSFDSEGITYTIYVSYPIRAEITGYTGSGTGVKIPSMVQYQAGPLKIDLKVTAIHDEVFRNKGLTSVVFEEPSNITSIGSYAFAGNPFTEIVLPQSLNASLIEGRGMFSECTALTSVKLPDAFSAIPAGMFEGCSALRSITVPSDLSVISSNAFDGCSSLSFDLPAGLTAIGAYAFHDSGMKQAVISDALLTAGESAFEGCRELTTVAIASGKLTGTTISERMFADCTSLKTVDARDVKYIRDEAFKGCTALEDVKTAHASEIGAYAFAGCSSLKAFEAEEIAALGEHAFEKCTSLESFGNYAGNLIHHTFNVYTFAGCTALKRVTFSANIVNVKISAFEGCPDGMDVYYGGTKLQWALMTVDSHNEALLKANVHFSKDPSPSPSPTPEPTPVPTPDSDTEIEMYRLYNPVSGEHFYTGSKLEREVLTAAGWKNEGVGFSAPKRSGTPMYRLYNSNSGDHHYTCNESERDMLRSAGWRYEGIAWYSDDAKTVAQYRLYNPNAKTGAHHYTSDEKERSYLVGMGWKDEGVGFYTCK